MGRASYGEIGGPGGLLARREPFQGNSMSARLEPDGAYVVTSYRTDIAWAAGDDVVITDQRYSTTTTRHTNMCRAWLVPESEARERMRREGERRAELAQRAAETTRERLDAFLPDVTLIGVAGGAQLRQLVYGRTS
jgi:hypothetical protein